MLLLSETVNGVDDGTRKGVAMFWFCLTLSLLVSPGVTGFCPSDCSCNERDTFAGVDMASNSLVKEMQVFPMSAFCEQVKVLITWSLLVALLQGTMSVFATGVLNCRFLIGVRSSGVPSKIKQLHSQTSISHRQMTLTQVYKCKLIFQSEKQPVFHLVLWFDVVNKGGLATLKLIL